jgi:hypothetical protein
MHSTGSFVESFNDISAERQELLVRGQWHHRFSAQLIACLLYCTRE